MTHRIERDEAEQAIRTLDGTGRVIATRPMTADELALTIGEAMDAAEGGDSSNGIDPAAYWSAMRFTSAVMGATQPAAASPVAPEASNANAAVQHGGESP